MIKHANKVTPIPKMVSVPSELSPKWFAINKLAKPTIVVSDERVEEDPVVLRM